MGVEAFYMSQADYDKASKEVEKHLTNFKIELSRAESSDEQLLLRLQNRLELADRIPLDFLERREMHCDIRLGVSKLLEHEWRRKELRDGLVKWVEGALVQLVRSIKDHGDWPKVPEMYLAEERSVSEDEDDP